MKAILFSFLAFSLTLAFFAPLNLYTQNHREFTFLFFPTLATFLLISLGLFFALTLLFLLVVLGFSFLPQLHLHHRLLRHLPLVFCGFTCLFWLQGNLLTLKYGPLNFRPIFWYRHQNSLIVNSLFWAFSLLTVFKFRHHLKPLILPVATGLLFIQLGNLAYLGFRLPSPSPPQLYQTDSHAFSQLSSTQNVIFILLDTFQADIFDTLINTYPSLADSLPGFTYYPNTAGSSPTTYTAIPALFTGQPYTNQLPLPTYISQAYQSASSLPLKLKQAGYRVVLPCSAEIWCDPKLSDSVKPLPRSLHLTTVEANQILRPTALRYLPPLAYLLYSQHKSTINQFIHRDISFDPPMFSFYQQDLTLSQNFVNSATATTAQPVFIFLHFLSPHPLFFMDSDLHYQIQPFNREGFITHAQSALKLAQSVLYKLQQLDLYDSSLIIILADHGLGDFGYLTDQNTLDQNPVIASSLPLFLVKPFNSRKPFQINSSPVSYLTLSTDIANYLTVTPTPIKITFSHQNTRDYYYYDWNDNWRDNYLPQITHYQITGPIRRPQSWSPPLQTFFPTNQ